MSGGGKYALLGFYTAMHLRKTVVAGFRGWIKDWEMWIVELKMEILWMIVLVIAGIQDFRERKVCVKLLAVGAAAGTLGMVLAAGGALMPVVENGTAPDMAGSAWGLMRKYIGMQAVRAGKAAGIGLFLLVLTKWTDGAVGGGDGLFFLMSAVFWDWRRLLVLFLGALGVSFVWGMVLLMKLQWSLEGRYPGRTPDTIPLLTCCVIPGICLVWSVWGT